MSQHRANSGEHHIFMFILVKCVKMLLLMVKQFYINYTDCNFVWFTKHKSILYLFFLLPSVFLLFYSHII